ncbi:MAG TPA: sigma-70 family RNA polymerase sigma factor [Ktedonobacterales bacterium]|nr:sigma-70 family RNA polymerase sigma factor [Ktedonobacterales bacterium]
MQESTAQSLTTAQAPISFNDVLAETQRPLFAFVASLVSDHELARDIVQDVFCDAWRAMQRGAPPFDAADDLPAMRRWLFHASYCDAASALRRGALIRWEPLDADDDAREPIRSAPGRPFEDTVAERLALDAALATLRPEDAACLLLSALQGFTAQEIGQIIDASTEATKKRLARAKRRVRDAYIALNRDEESRP